MTYTADLTLAIESYLRDLGAALAGAPEDDRELVISDVRAHIEESLAALSAPSIADLHSILNELGPPAQIADDSQPPPSRSRRSSHRRLVWGAVAAILVVGGITLGLQLSSTSPKTALDLYLQGIALQHQNKTTLAAEKYKAAISLDPDAYYADYALGSLYQLLNTTSPAAATAYKSALRIRPNFEPALFNLAILESSSGTPVGRSEAIGIYKRLQKGASQNAAAVAFNLGLVYRQTGDVTDGNAQLRRAIKLNSALRSMIPMQYQPID